MLRAGGGPPRRPWCQAQVSGTLGESAIKQPGDGIALIRINIFSAHREVNAAAEPDRMA
jgi:hypothetical protein